MFRFQKEKKILSRTNLTVCFEQLACPILLLFGYSKGSFDSKDLHRNFGGLESLGFFPILVVSFIGLNPIGFFLRNFLYYFP